MLYEDFQESAAGAVEQSRYLLVTVDAEGDNLWSRPQHITTQNSRSLPRFQELCERFGFKPTYLTNYEMAEDPFFQEFGRDLVERGRAEIGMHLHAWNSPPLDPLTGNDYYYQPYLIEYPHDVMRRKIEYLTKFLEDTFQSRITSHRAGRWAFNEVYARLLRENGYRVDCSVTPHISWRSHIGDPSRYGGTDYTDFPDRPYLIDLSDISKPGRSDLLELPLTVILRRKTRIHSFMDRFRPTNRLRRAYNLVVPPYLMLSPRRWRLGQLLSILRQSLKEDRAYLEFMTHSSNLMPEGGPAFPTRRAVERLYGSLAEFFELASDHFAGATLSEYGSLFTDHRSSSGRSSADRQGCA